MQARRAMAVFDHGFADGLFSHLVATVTSLVVL